MKGLGKLCAVRTPTPGEDAPPGRQPTRAARHPVRTAQADALGRTPGSVSGLQSPKSTFSQPSEDKSMSEAVRNWYSAIIIHLIKL